MDRIKEKLTTIADEVRELSGVSNSISLDDMKNKLSDANNEVDSQTDLITQIQDALHGKASGGFGDKVDWSENENAIIGRTLSEYTNSVVTHIGSYAFQGCPNLTSVNFPAVKTISDHAFARCPSLTTVSLPIATSIKLYVFQGCSNLTSVNFPNASYIGGYAFTSCNNLTTVICPKTKAVNTSTFNSCTNLTTVSFPLAEIINANAFNSCIQLGVLSFPKMTKIYSKAFANCYKLSKLYLANSSVCTLSASDAFLSTPYAGYSASFSGTPCIYVPASLVSAYQSAANWTYFSKYFSAIEDIDNDD